jgi:hypothetical protein
MNYDLKTNDVACAFGKKGVKDGCFLTLARGF